MNYIACNGCPTKLDCGFSKTCWNLRVTQAQIKVELAKFDAMIAARPVWEPAKPAAPGCPHSERSAIGICLHCGNWK